MGEYLFDWRGGVFALRRCQPFLGVGGVLGVGLFKTKENNKKKYIFGF
jgi:hypothetical protein